jgi:hypothetical protein
MNLTGILLDSKILAFFFGISNFFYFHSWILNWLNEHPYSAQATQFSVSTVISRGGQRLPGEGLDTTAPPVYFLPAYGE